MTRFAFFLGCVFVFAWVSHAASACCAVSRAIDRVVNADQTVIIVWDPETQRQHFIRQASFKSNSEKDIGFIVPSPSRPDLEEAGNEAFARLKLITAPVIRSGGGSGFACSKSDGTYSMGTEVEVLESKRLAGFDAVVLKAGSVQALVEWLAKNGYAYSDEVAAWAQPYVAQGWPFTALKVAPVSDSSTDRKAAALRISFQTSNPLFPYREPESAQTSKDLGAAMRLLRIYFISDQAYEGQFENGLLWGGKKVWSGDISADRHMLLAQLKLPVAESGPWKWWLTEFEDNWPYAKAPGDILFKPSSDQKPIIRTATRFPIDPLPLAVMVIALALFTTRHFKT